MNRFVGKGHALSCFILTAKNPAPSSRTACGTSTLVILNEVKDLYPVKSNALSSRTACGTLPPHPSSPHHHAIQFLVNPGHQFSAVGGG